MVADFRPEAIVHYAEQRAAPYSMIDQAHAVYTQTNNVVGNLNVMYAIADTDRDIHLVKLGTMGEYGTPNIDIEEGWLEVEHNGRRDRMIYPKRPGSFYHCSKVHDSTNIEFGCRIWGLRATDLNQGVVYGAEVEAAQARPAARDQVRLRRRVRHRAQPDGDPGRARPPPDRLWQWRQTRGMINLVDTVECIRLACENPADRGEFRVFNQMTESMSIRQIAETVAGAYPGEATIEHLPNPRVELEDHYYNVKHSALEGLGLKPTLLSSDADRPSLRRRRALQGSRGPAGDHADGRLAGDLQHAAQGRRRAAADEVSSDGGELRGRRVIVTGGSGFIGRHVVAELTKCRCARARRRPAARTRTQRSTSFRATSPIAPCWSGHSPTAPTASFTWPRSPRCCARSSTHD